MSRCKFSLLFLWKKCKELKFSVRILMILFSKLTFFVKYQGGWSGVENNIWLSSLFLVGKPQKNWRPSFASNHTNNAHIPTSQLLMTSSLTSLRTKGFPLSAPHYSHVHILAQIPSSNPQLEFHPTIRLLELQSRLQESGSWLWAWEFSHLVLVSWLLFLLVTNFVSKFWHLL